jgi:uncharacterized small protein (DUF1192 family)
MPDQRRNAQPVDAFILFNEREDGVEQIVEHLEKEGISTYFWRRDISGGESWEPVEDQHIRSASATLVFLGSQGWGPTHEKLAEAARQQGRFLIPILIGTPGEGALLKVDRLFQKVRHIDFRNGETEAFQLLVRTVKEARKGLMDASRFDGVIQTIVDGDESDRLATLEQIRRSRMIDRRLLSARLRNEIENNFGTAAETTFAASIRDPNKIASIRSWLMSCLISTDREAEENRSFVMRHLSESVEPEKLVRYWTLSQLYAARVSYLTQSAEAVLSDSGSEISLMGRAILSPDNPAFLEECRSRLGSSNFEVAWTVLRMLRAVPVAALAPDVCTQLNQSFVGTPIAYDALSALCSPPMAKVAAPILLLSPGLATTVQRIMMEAGKSDRAAAGRFGVLLSEFPSIEVRQIIDEAIGSPETNRGARLLRNVLQESASGPTRPVNVTPIASDTNNIAHDYLDIREDVQTLAAVMLAREVVPPLAIGLFGDWGSGKSFFMASLRKATNVLAASNQPKICSSVVSIDFNAWHYADTNLWASMVDYILEQLSAHVAPKASLEEQKANLLTQLGSERALVRATEEERRRTQDLIDTRAADLQDAKRTREQKEILLRDLKASDFRSLIDSDPSLKKNLTDALNQLGLACVVETEAELAVVAADASRLTSQLAALLKSVWDSTNPLLLVGLTAVILFGFPFLAGWIARISGSGTAAGVGAAIVEIGTLLLGAARVIGGAMGRVRSSVITVSKAKRTVDELLAKKRSEASGEEIDLQNQIAALKAKEHEAAARLSVATERVAELEERIAATQKGLSLAQFLMDRNKSEDYRKHLGLLSTIRRDFDSLAKRLSAPPQTGDTFRPVDRIVLYIDDLDRCPETKVLEVLQAVHLLLAYPIFVVVVGVDPRWLMHALKHSFAALRTPDEKMAIGGALSFATPQNYMEKIFQIPFSLRPMSQSGYSHLVDALLTPTIGDAEQTAPLDVPDPESLERKPQGQENPKVVDPSKPIEPANIDPPGKPNIKPGHSNEAAPIVHEESMTIRLWETRFAERLFALVPTPRSAKRFTNIYRILKAPIKREDLSSFEGSEDLLGDFQLPMLLLAIMIGYPEECRLIFPLLWNEARSLRNPGDVLRSLGAQYLESPQMKTIQMKVRDIVSDAAFPSEPSVYEFWIPRVSRFSFDLAQAVELSRYAVAN